MERYRLTVEVEVWDPDALLGYAGANWRRWGRGDPEEAGDVGEALYESLVLNVIPGGPDAVGVEVLGHTVEREE